MGRVKARASGRQYDGPDLENCTHLVIPDKEVSLVQQEIGSLKLLRNRKLLQSRRIHLAGVNHDLPSTYSTRIWFYLAFNLNARLYTSREKEIEQLRVDLALPDSTLHNPRAVSNEEKDHSTAGAFVLNPSPYHTPFPSQPTLPHIPPHHTFLKSTT